jgi:hypothetical protein
MKDVQKVATGTSPRNHLLAPFTITKRQLHGLFNSPRLVQRMIAAKWIDVVRAGKPGRESLFDYGSAAKAYDRLKSGEEPGLLACELMSKEAK